jgi:hypothetical protein
VLLAQGRRTAAVLAQWAASSGKRDITAHLVGLGFNIVQLMVPALAFPVIHTALIIISERRRFQAESHPGIRAGSFAPAAGALRL